jgi:hypothetical protein
MVINNEKELINTNMLKLYKQDSMELIKLLPISDNILNIKINNITNNNIIEYDNKITLCLIGTINSIERLKRFLSIRKE